MGFELEQRPNLGWKCEAFGIFFNWQLSLWDSGCRFVRFLTISLSQICQCFYVYDFELMVLSTLTASDLYVWFYGDRPLSVFSYFVVWLFRLYFVHFVLCCIMITTWREKACVALLALCMAVNAVSGFYAQNFEVEETLLSPRSVRQFVPNVW